MVNLAINQPNLMADWLISPVIKDTTVHSLQLFPSWKSLKVSRSANFQVHLVAKWFASHNVVFGSILKDSPLSFPLV